MGCSKCPLVQALDVSFGSLNTQVIDFTPHLVPDPNHKALPCVLFSKLMMRDGTNSGVVWIHQVISLQNLTRYRS